MSDFPDNFPPDQSRRVPSDEERAMEWELADLHRRELEPHRGRARAAFEAAVSATPAQNSLGIGKGRAWWIGSGLGLAAAAALAAGVGAGFWGSSQVLDGLADGPRPVAIDGHSPIAGSGATIHADWAPTNAARQEVWRTHDAGQLLIDGRPTRALLNERWQTTQFTDADGFGVTITLPEHQMVFVDVGEK